MKSAILFFSFLVFPLLTFASTETRKSMEFVMDSLKRQTLNQVVAKDSLAVGKLPIDQKIAKTSGILGIIGLGLMIVLGVASIGTLAVLIGSGFSFLALIMGLYSVRKVKKKKWARLGIILGLLGILVLVAWIALIIYVISIFSNGF